MKTKYLTLGLLATFPILCGCNKTDAMKDYINNINKYIAEDRENIRTCYDAVISARNHGLEVENLKPNNGLTLSFDVSNKQFVLFDGNTIKYAPDGYKASNNSMDYFRFVDTYNPNVTYSQYLKSSANDPSQLLITTGFDCGEHKNIKKVAYTNLAENGKNVVVRTDCDYFSVLAPRDTVHHYNFATNVLLTEVKDYELEDYVSYIKVTEGNVTFNEGSTCEIFQKSPDDLGEEKTVTCDKKEGSTIYRSVNIDDEIAESKLPVISIKDADGFKKAAASEDASFVRLDADIDITYSGETSPLIFSTGTCIDLNGNKLKFTNGVVGSSQKSEALRIQPKTGSDKELFFYIVDSKGVIDENSGIELNDSSILVTSMVSGTEGVGTSFVVNSGKIKQVINEGTTPTDDQLAAAIAILGQTVGESPKNAKGYFYGGSIQTVNNRSTYKKAGCIGVAGKGSQASISYGRLTSTDYCVIGDTTTGFDLSGTVVNIDGGTLTSSDKPCIYFPLSNELNINGGTLTGPSCINMVSGDITINNTTLNANAKYDKTQTNNYDGSVILSPNVTLTKEDKNNLNVEVTNSKLYSHYAYIASIYGDNTKENVTTLNYNSGYFDYHLGNGNYKESSSVILKDGGTWNKHYA